MVFVHSRITNEDDVVLNSVILWIRSNAKCILAVQEIAKNGKKHIHVMSEYSKTISTFGQKILKDFPNLKGNGSHSTQEFKESYDHNLRYLSKGTKETLPVVLFTILEESVIKDAHDRFWEVQKQFLIEKGVSPEDKKKKNVSMIERIVREIPRTTAEAYVGLQAFYNPTDYEKKELYDVKEEIMDTVIECFGQFAKMCNDSIITNHINGTYLRLVSIYGNQEEKKAFKKTLKGRIRQNTF